MTPAARAAAAARAPPAPAAHLLRTCRCLTGITVTAASKITGQSAVHKRVTLNAKTGAEQVVDLHTGAVRFASPSTHSARPYRARVSFINVAAAARRQK